ncbi:MAG: O-antigen ligase family protein [Patescibacteria group bacterium]|jgi:O-antigen ligase
MNNYSNKSSSPATPAAKLPVWWLVLGLAVIEIPLLLLFVNQPGWRIIIQIALMLLMIPFFLVEHRYGFAALLILRPAMDIFSNDELARVGPFSLNLSSVIGLLAIVWILTYIIGRQIAIWRIRLFWPFAILVGLSIVSLTYTLDIGASLREVVRIASIFFIYLLAAALFERAGNRALIIKALLASLVIPAVVGLIQFVTGTGTSFGGVNNRIYGTFGHPNALAYYLVLMLGIIIVLTQTASNRFRRNWYLAGIGLLALLLLLTGSRGAWLGAAIVAIGLLWSARKNLILGLAGTTVLLILLFPYINNFTFNQFNVNMNRWPLIQRLTDSNVEESSLTWRMSMWSEMRRHISDRPLTGYGLGTFPIIREQYVKNFFESTEAHNDYLRLTIELGWTGVILYVVLLVILLIRLAQYIRLKTGGLRRWYVAGFALAVAFAVMSFFDNLLQGTAVQWAFWTVMAGLLSQSLVADRQRK